MVTFDSATASVTVEQQAVRISVSRALAKLKSIEGKLKSLPNKVDFQFFAVVEEMEDVEEMEFVGGNYLKEHERLIKEYTAIKNAVMAANATTEVVVEGKSFTVSEAIEHKRVLEFERTYFLQPVEELKKKVTENAQGRKIWQPDHFWAYYNKLKAKQELLSEFTLAICEANSLAMIEYRI